MSSLNESLKTLLTTELVVNLVPVSSPVAVEAIWGVVNNWRDPDGIKAKILNILEVLYDAIEVTTTVVWLTVEIAG
jgi:hypothetical protein